MGTAASECGEVLGGRIMVWDTMQVRNTTR